MERRDKPGMSHKFWKVVESRLRSRSLQVMVNLISGNENPLKLTKFNYPVMNILSDTLLCVSVLTPNGPVVWGVAVCVGAGEVFANPGRWMQVFSSR